MLGEAIRVGSRAKGSRMNVLLISPETPDTFWSFKYALRFVSKRAAFPPLGLLTVAAMLPRSWNLRLVDLNLTRLKDVDLRWADYAMVGAMIVHRESVGEIVRRCKMHELPLIAGGPLFTTSSESFPEIAHFALGESEDVISELAADMEQGTLRRFYRAEGRPDITRVPIPRWDLLDFHYYASMSVQFSRGCPYDCEFCDIIVMNGRVPRTKTPRQLVAELESLRRAGWRSSVFLVDDNFIGNRARVKELLRAIIAWRRHTGTRMEFFTEASVNLGDDAELMRLMVDAGFKKVFLGVETPSLESLRECHKLQNTRRDLVDSVRDIQEAGLEVMGGFIVGFDNDTADIFQRQFEFIQRAGVVTAMVGLLTALPDTKLYKRMLAEGRLIAESCGNNTEAILNFVPKLDRELLVGGYRKLMRSLYEPSVYYSRVREFLAHYRAVGPRPYLGWGDVVACFRSIWLLGVRYPGRRPFWALLGHTLLRYPGKFSRAVTLAVYGHHFRLVAERL